MSSDHHSPPLPPEPETPAWLTSLGGVLLAIAAVWWLTALSADQRAAGAARAASDPASAAPSASASAH